jgi:hypothetical protein
VDRHLTILATLVRIWGVLAVIVGVSLLLLALGAVAILVDADSASLGVAAGLTTAVLATLGVSALLWGGAHIWAEGRLRRRDPQGRIVALALALVNLLILPFGTALGAYALWVLLANDGRRLFDARRNHRPAPPAAIE